MRTIGRRWSNFIKDDTYSIIAVLLTGFFLRLLVAGMDPFLHPWDERFHALVARNMMHHPFQPMLRAFPITDNFDPNAWCCNHIWLHKQPLFMWQMALSMKIFGVSELALRLPSVIMGTLLILMLYRITLLLTKDKTTALIAAAILCVSNFHLQLISGIRGMDHNDVAMGFYVLASIWAYAEYLRKPKIHWVLLVGMFAGCAVLCKWLVGLLVFLGWGINVISSSSWKGFFEETKYFLLALLVCCAVFVPWQIYILNAFPEEARYEFAYNSLHLTEAVEGHGGNRLFYLERLDELVGKYIYLLAPIGMVVAFAAKNFNKKLRLALIAEIVFVLFFFSVIAATKIVTYVYFIVPLIILFIATALKFLIETINRRWIAIPIIVAALYLSLNPGYFVNYLDSSNQERADRIYNASVYRNLKQYLPKDVHVVMNMNSFEDVPVMFYNNDITAYHWTLPEVDFQKFAEQKLPIAVFEPHGAYQLPDYVTSYPYIHIIKVRLVDFQ